MIEHNALTVLLQGDFNPVHISVAFFSFKGVELGCNGEWLGGINIVGATRSVLLAPLANLFPRLRLDRAARVSAGIYSSGEAEFVCLHELDARAKRLRRGFFRGMIAARLRGIDQVDTCGARALDRREVDFDREGASDVIMNVRDINIVVHPCAIIVVDDKVIALHFEVVTKDAGNEEHLAVLLVCLDVDGDPLRGC